MLKLLSLVLIKISKTKRLCKLIISPSTILQSMQLLYYPLVKKKNLLNSLSIHLTSKKLSFNEVFDKKSNYSIKKLKIKLPIIFLSPKLNTLCTLPNPVRLVPICLLRLPSINIFSLMGILYTISST